MKIIVDIFVFSIPEAIVLFILASSLSGKKILFKRLAVMGAIFGVTVFLNRQTTESFILSALLSCFLIIVLLKWVGSLEIYEAITSGLMALSLYLVIQFINIKILQMLTHIDPSTLQASFSRRVLWFLPQLLLTLALARIICYFINRNGKRKVIIKENDYEDKYL